MAFSQEEQKIIQWSIQNGKSSQDMKEAVLRFRETGSPEDPNKITPKHSALEVVKDVGVGAGKGFIEGSIETTSLMQKLGQGFLATIDPTKSYAEIREETGLKSLDDEGVRELLKAKNEYEVTGKIAGFIGEILVGGGAGIIKGGVKKGGRLAGVELGKGKELISKGAEEVTEKIPLMRGLVQKGKEVFERIPRILGKSKEEAERLAIRADRIKESVPSVQKAFKAGVDERIINTVVQSDTPTIKAYKEMTDIAEQGSKTLKPAQQPSIVAGRVVGDQFDLIEKQRKLVGGNIETAISKLPKVDVNMSPSIRQLNAVLQENGIRVIDGTLDISGSTLTKQQGLRLQELYETATRAGDIIPAKMVHGMDRVFSQLQREARFDKLDNIFVEVNGEKVNAFTLFRDIYRNQLDNLSPEIRKLNKEYAILRTKIDDIENSILKTPNFEATKATDPAEFAKVNLRRLAGEAQSSPAYEAVVKDMDEFARGLGYEGAHADDLIYFTQELRKLYPETIPPTGFTGGIKLGLSDIAERVLKAGAPDIKDQQKALRIMLEELLKKQ